MNKKTNFPDLERLPKTNFWKHLFNYWWNRPRVFVEDIHEKYILKPKEKKEKIELDRITNETELLNQMTKLITKLITNEIELVNKMTKLELELSKIKKNSTK
jgi:hypothetical protein